LTKKVRISDIKAAMNDERFVVLLPKELDKDVEKYKKNPNCSCNSDFYKKLLKNHKNVLLNYFPDYEVDEQEVLKVNKNENQWHVINCHIDELQNNLKLLGPGRKQVQLSRFEDQVTCVVNDLDIVR